MEEAPKRGKRKTPPASEQSAKETGGTEADARDSKSQLEMMSSRLEQLRRQRQAPKK